MLRDVGTSPVDATTGSGSCFPGPRDRGYARSRPKSSRILKDMRAGLYPLVKRVLDVVIVSVGLTVLFPLMIAIGVLVKLDSRGPVFYRGLRIGRYGRPFEMLKFRTMVEGGDKLGAASTPEDDPRITRVGEWLRRYKLDELPQLINVLRGEMSLVGPRPQVPWAVELYDEEERKVLLVRPGMTDYASLWFRNEGEILRGSDDPDRDYLEKIHPHKMRLSLKYLQEASLWTDLRVLVSTIATLARRGDRQDDRSMESRGTTENRS